MGRYPGTVSKLNTDKCQELPLLETPQINFNLATDLLCRHTALSLNIFAN